VHNRSLCKEARPTVRVSGSVAALIQKAINSDQSSEAKRSILAFHNGFYRRRELWNEVGFVNIS